MVERALKADRQRRVWLLLLPVLLLLLMGLLAPSALARGAWNHDGASCGTGCHVDTPIAGPDNGECATCHTGFARRAGATQDCWTCHQPGASMTALQQQAGCVGTCHFYNDVTGTYTNDAVAHGPAPHYASAIKNCTACHGVATGPAAPDGSPHHDAVNSAAPTSTDCLTCHGSPPVDAAPPAHGDLQTGIVASDCGHCHVGMADTHPTAAALINPRLTAVARTSAGDVTVSGTLKAGTTVLPNFTGWVQWKGPADMDWAAARQMAVTTTSTGTFKATIAAPVAGTTYRVIFEGGVYKGKTYGPSLVTPRWKTTITIRLVGVRNGSIRVNRYVTVQGLVSPARAGKATVTFQRKIGTRWTKMRASARTINATTGAYSYRYKVTRRGAWRVNVKVAQTATYTSAKTSWKSFRVR